MMMSDKEIQFLFDYLDNTQHVLEYGSGDSTVEISKIVKSLVSIEHDKGWYNKNVSIVSDNTTLILKEPDTPFKKSSSDGSYEQYFSFMILYLHSSVEQRMQNVLII